MSISGDKFEGVLHPVRKLKSRLGPLWWHSLLMFAATRLGDVVNLYVGAFLVPAFVSQRELGMVLPLTQLGLLMAVPINVVSRTAAKYMNVFKTHGELGKIKRLLRDLIVVSLIYSVFIVFYLWFGRAFIGARLKFDSPFIVVLVAAIGVVACWVPAATMASQGLKEYYRLTASRIVRPVVRLIFILLLLDALGIVGYLSATLVSGVAVIAFLIGGIRQYLRKSIKAESYHENAKTMLAYLIPVGLTVLLAGLQKTAEPWIVRQRLSAMDSAGYYVATVFGSIPMYVVGAILPFLFPVVSERHELRQSTRRLHIQSAAMTFVVGMAIVVLLRLSARSLLSLRPSWSAYVGYAPYLWRLALMTTLNSVFLCHMWHENACRRFRYLAYYAPLVILEVVILYALMGWPLLQDWLPTVVWEPVARWDVRRLSFIVTAMIVSRAIVACCVVVEMSSIHAAQKGAHA